MADKCASLAHAACRQPRPAPDRVGVWRLHLVRAPQSPRSAVE